MALQKNNFTQAVVNAMRKGYPEELADRSWDNVGLLLENSDSPRSRLIVLLTNDLTPGVADEAIERGASVIVSYHPPIFRGLKSLTLDDPQQRLLLKLMQNNVAVYSPHTALDAAPGGINDFLVDTVCPSPSPPDEESNNIATRAAIKPLAGPVPAGFDGAGYGRYCTFKSPLPLNTLLKNLGFTPHQNSDDLSQENRIRYVSVAFDRAARKLEDIEIRSVGVCAGSGADVLAGCDADLLVTGEMSHHAALAAVMRGQVVATVFHSNSERGFLDETLRPYLEGELVGFDASVLVSERDMDPFRVVDTSSLS